MIRPDLKVGVGVRYHQADPTHPPWQDQVGTLIELNESQTWGRVEFDQVIEGKRRWGMSRAEIADVLQVLSPEEEKPREDQKRREAHADKYL